MWLSLILVHGMEAMFVLFMYYLSAHLSHNVNKMFKMTYLLQLKSLIYYILSSPMILLIV